MFEQINFNCNRHTFCQLGMIKRSAPAFSSAFTLGSVLWGWKLWNNPNWTKTLNGGNGYMTSKINMTRKTSELKKRLESDGNQKTFWCVKLWHFSGKKGLLKISIKIIPQEQMYTRVKCWAIKAVTLFHCHYTYSRREYIPLLTDPRGFKKKINPDSSSFITTGLILISALQPRPRTGLLTVKLKAKGCTAEKTTNHLR